MAGNYQPYGSPPPPGTPRSASVNYAFQHPRRRVDGTAVPQPPSLTTSFLRTQGGRSSQSQTPVSGALSPNTPGSYIPRTPLAQQYSPGPQSQYSTPATPAMAQQPYNPRQWSQRGHGSMSQIMFQARDGGASASTTREVTGMEAAMPSPPPPYTPGTPEKGPAAVRPSPLVEHGSFTASPSTFESSARGPNLGQSPQIPSSPAFPPPPPQPRHRDRSASGQAGARFFSLSNLRGKQPASYDLPGSSSMHAARYDDPPLSPPAARRAASTGHVPTSSSVPILQPVGGRKSSDRWQPGMPLPPPPPGPPPPGTRSQSLNRYPATSSRSNSASSEQSFEAPRTRIRTTLTNTLGAVPPTPADWVDEDMQPGRRPQDTRPPASTTVTPLRIETGASRDSVLIRRPARRDASNSAGIRERRSRSRAAREAGADDDSRPSDLVLSPSSGTLNRRREHTRTASGYPESLVSPSEPLTVIEPRRDPVTAIDRAQRAQLPSQATVLTPPYTPAVSVPEHSISQKRVLQVPASASSDRPISHILHAPNEDSAMQAPLSPWRPSSAVSNIAKAPMKLDSFALQAIERHRRFVEKEAAATSDEERLELFANFMVNESRLRRDRYTAAYNAMAGDIVDLTRDMWRTYSGTTKRIVTPSTSMSSFDQTIPSSASDWQPSSGHAHGPGSASSIGDFTPATDVGSTFDASESAERAESRNWGEQFRPSLSPIPSMAVSTVPSGDAGGESSSRGRTQSRWWEGSKSGSGSIGNAERMEKTRRETKYMGVSVAAFNDSPQTSPELQRHTPTPGASTEPYGYGADEYPAEKTGWHEPDFDTPMATPQRHDQRHANTPGLEALDVSRLVTLPPPYPRHHPALSNSHPALSDLRGAHRLLVDRQEIQRIKDAYLDQEGEGHQQHLEGAKERRSEMRDNIHSLVSAGSMTYADAAKAEAEFDLEESERGKAEARSNFDTYETSVAQPLNALLVDRTQKADIAIRQLQSELDIHNESSNPNTTQEEGDAQPERLEKLTLLKWLFEAREQLHAELYALHARRSEKYSEVILSPYIILRAQAKIDEATAFFAKDSRERQLSYARDALARYRELQTCVDENVSRGVEDQLSAFWDIAPGLMEVIQHVPNRAEDCDIEILPLEYEENPSYAEFPLQYLYTVLGHAEISARQFIESQTNLLCLLHEVRTAASSAALRLQELQTSRIGEGEEDEVDLRRRMGNERKEREEWLTRDLKEKVGEVERQWREALGEGIEVCKGRVKGWLEETGGWEDGLEG